MITTAQPRPLDRFSQISDLADSVRWLLRRAMLPLSILLVGETGILFVAGNRGATAFALISAGTMIVLAAWRVGGTGLPVVPLIAAQNLLVYGLPIVVNHEVLANYPESFTTKSGLEVLIFSCALAAAWRFGMGFFHPAPPASFALRGFKREGATRLKRLGFSLIIASSAYLVIQSLGLLGTFYALLPEGSYSLLQALVSAASVCGFFLISMFVGTRDIPPSGRFVFWLLLAGNCFINASGFLLSATTAILGSVLIGLFWSNGRMPWRYLTAILLILSFLNLGKVTMREQYWATDGETAPQFTLDQMPGHYAEWIEASYQALNPPASSDSLRDGHNPAPKAQSLLERINNLQNLLFVLDAMETSHLTPLYGETYTLIPPLLMPRILWPEKPRTHEGQVRLNVHFGRQDLDSTLQTYIAWGLLPEAVGNFGDKYGGIFLGVALGLIFSWMENYTTRKLLLSLEGFASFTILLSMVSSFEMVASVLVTTIFQSVMMLVVASFPFVERTVLKRPESRSP